MIRSVADKRPSAGTLPGGSIALQLHNDLAAQTSVLSETEDVDSVAIATPNIVNLTLNEYGNSVTTTRKLKLFSLSEVDPAVANMVAFNMADSIDKLAMAELAGGSNVLYGGDATSTASLGTGGVDKISAAQIRKAVAKLRSNNAVPRKGSMYWVGIHPEASHDLRSDTGAANWRDPHVYSDPSNIWSGEIGAFEGAYFIETPRMSSSFLGASTGAGSTPTYTGTGVSAAFTIVLTTAVSATTQVGYIVTGTNVGTDARITAISADRLTLTLSVANSGTITAGTITVQPTHKVYNTIVAGQQALAEAVAEEPHVVIGNTVDRLNRLTPVGWYGVLGFKRYREEALYRIESNSSIA
jgi:N4-gp56 family major capsid protein